MKTSPLLLPLGVAVLAGSLLFLSGHPRPAPAATTARTIAARPALAITDPAPPRPPPAHSRASSNANDTADLVADQRLLQQVLPSLDRPVTDWRRFTPAKLTVVPAPGLPLEFTATSITTGGARTTWIGTNPEQAPPWSPAPPRRSGTPSSPCPEPMNTAFTSPPTPSA